MEWSYIRTLFNVIYHEEKQENTAYKSGQY